MGSMHNSVDAIEEMMQTIKTCADALETASQKIAQAASGDWDDEISQAYSSQMKRISGLVGKPVSDLRSAGQKLVKLKSAVENYQRIRFN